MCCRSYTLPQSVLSSVVTTAAILRLSPKAKVPLNHGTPHSVSRIALSPPGTGFVNGHVIVGVHVAIGSGNSADHSALCSALVLYRSVVEIARLHLFELSPQLQGFPLQAAR